MPTYVQGLNGFKIKRLSYYIWLAGCILSASTACSSYATDQDIRQEDAQLQHISQDDILVRDFESKNIEVEKIEAKNNAAKNNAADNIQHTDVAQGVAIAPAHVQPTQAEETALEDIEADGFSETALEAEQTTIQQAPARALQFDSSALMGSFKERDLSIYAIENPIVAGTYPVQVFINGIPQGSQVLKFEAIAGTDRIEHCFSVEEIVHLNLDIQQLQIADPEQCLTLDHWIKDAKSQLNSAQFRYDLTIPQAYLKRMSRGEVPFEIWDRGINAAFLSYDFNQQYSQFDGKSSSDLYLRLNAGINIAGWQFRHNAMATEYAQQSRKYERINSYAQRAFPQYGSLATVGESFTIGRFMPSFPFTGVELRSDDRMLPESQRGYAPVIRGVAQSNAMVEVRQNEQVIYKLSVPPGPFVVDDLYDTGSGGDLEVTVLEADGSIQRFKVPFASVNLALRDGQQRYSVTAGQLRQDNLGDEKFIQASYQRGLNGFMTSYAASTLSQVYQAYQLGTAFLTPLGAVSFDVTHADTKPSTATRNTNGQFDFGSDSGQSYRLMFNKTFLPSQTNINLSASHQSGRGFYHFQDAVRARERIQSGYDISLMARERNQFNLNVQQNLGTDWGRLYFTASRRDFFDQSEAEVDYQIGYSNNFKNLNYSLSMQRVYDGAGQSDDHYMAMLTLPLTFKEKNISLNQFVTDNGNGTNIHSTLGKLHQYNLSAGFNDIGYSKSSQYAGVQYRSPYATTGLNGYFYSDKRQNYNFNMNGAVVAHTQGISFSPEMVDTMVLVKADQAKGVAVKNTAGLKIDRWGYAVIPYVTAYRMNEIVLDPSDAVDQVELLSTIKELAPYAGAIAKVEFKTVPGMRLVIKSRQPNGKALPFAASVLNQEGESMGVVAQGSQILLRTNQTQANVVVKWGDAEDEQCQISYQLDKKSKAAMGYQQIEEQCK